ncbi:MAG TPA: D-alanine--D-alanine ligase [Candidatus Paceibacterota bacterium]|nr:D-alanine--D-alanine ligase [Candidatus Paceibacterota bacterium]
MSKIRVGVLRGGPSSEYEVSLKSGQSVLESLPEKYEVSDILITRDGAWNVSGLMSSPVRAMRRTDVFFNALHGEYGEDGKLQQMLDHHQFPYTGSGALASAFGMHKLLSKKRFAEAGLLTPQFYFFRENPLSKNHEGLELLAAKRASEVFRAFPGPWVVKPVAGGSSIGVTVARTVEALTAALLEALLKDEIMFVEEMIAGKEATCGVLEQYRSDKYFALPPIEIRAPSGFFDYQSKYDGSSEEIPYGSFSGREIESIQKTAKKVHEILGLKHYSRTDCMVTPRGEIYVLEVNTLPGLTSESLLPKSLRAAGIAFPAFLDHVITSALEA